MMGRLFGLKRVAKSGRRLAAAALATTLLWSLLAPHALAEGEAPAPTPAPAAAVEEPPFTIHAQAAVLMDAGTGQVLMQKDPDTPMPTASLAKVMTMRLAFEALKNKQITLDQEVVVSPNAWAGRFPGSSLMFLNAGERVKVRDLLYGIAVASGNDACVAMAETISGSTEAFVTAMNEEASKLGLKSASFEDPHGLSPDDRLSALEMAQLTREYVSSPYWADEKAVGIAARDIHRTKEFTYGTDINTGKPIVQRNRNGLLWSYPDADGLKTGHTSQAGFNLVGTAQRGDMRLIAVVMGTPDVVNGQSGEKYREQEVAAMLNWGFSNFTTVSPVPAGQKVDQIGVYKGRKGQVDATPAKPAAVTVKRGQEKNITLKTEMTQRYLVAPVAQGQQVGTLIILSGDKELSRVALVAAEEVPRGGFFRVIWDSVRLLFAGLKNRF